MYTYVYCVPSLYLMELMIKWMKSKAFNGQLFANLQFSTDFYKMFVNRFSKRIVILFRYHFRTVIYTWPNQLK